MELRGGGGNGVSDNDLAWGWQLAYVPVVAGDQPAALNLWAWAEAAVVVAGRLQWQPTWYEQPSVLGNQHLLRAALRVSIR